MTVRFVLDSNVLVSALLFEDGSLSWLRAAWARRGSLRKQIVFESCAAND